MENNLQKLIIDAKAGDEQAIKTLVLQWTRYVSSIARTHWTKLLSHGLTDYLDYSDLMDYGIEGLLKAIGKFDMKKTKSGSIESAFKTFAWWKIDGAIRDGMREYFGRELHYELPAELPAAVSGEETYAEEVAVAKQYEITTTSNMPIVAPGGVDVKVLSSGEKKKKKRKKKKKKKEESIFKNFTSATIKGLLTDNRVEFYLSLNREELAEVLKPMNVGDMVKFIKAFNALVSEVYIEENSIGEVYNIDNKYVYVKLLHKTDHVGLTVKLDKKVVEEYLLKM